LRGGVLVVPGVGWVRVFCFWNGGLSTFLPPHNLQTRFRSVFFFSFTEPRLFKQGPHYGPALLTRVSKGLARSVGISYGLDHEVPPPTSRFFMLKSTPLVTLLHSFLFKRKNGRSWEISFSRSSPWRKKDQRLSAGYFSSRRRTRAFLSPS